MAAGVSAQVRWVARFVAVTLAAAGWFAAAGPPASASPPSEHEAVAGFSPATGDAFGVVFADGSVRPGPFGDAFALHLGVRVTGGASAPDGRGYWEVTADGNVFNRGDAVAYGGTGGVPLNAPVFAIAPTTSGKGYWLVSRDGGVFTFGDAKFLGSAGGIRLSQPIVGITTIPSGAGYRMVARDGGVFSFGKVPFEGSLPNRRVHVADVVGLASTPTGKGYWIARRDGHVYAFGDAQPFGGVWTSSCDPIAAIIGNPIAQGYRLVTDSGRTAAFGDAPAGDPRTGPPRVCGRATARIELPSATITTGASMTGYLVVDNETRKPLSLRTAANCKPKWAVSLSSDQVPNLPIFTTECTRQRLVFPVGESQYAFTLRASYGSWQTGACTQCPPPLPPGDYAATFSHLGGAFPLVAPVPVTVEPRP